MRACVCVCIFGLYYIYVLANTRQFADCEHSDQELISAFSLLACVIKLMAIVTPSRDGHRHYAPGIRPAEKDAPFTSC